MLWTLAFWKGAGERALKSGVAAFGSVLGGNTVGVLHLDGMDTLNLVIGAILISVCTSIGNADFTAGVPTQPTFLPPTTLK